MQPKAALLLFATAELKQEESRAGAKSAAEALFATAEPKQEESNAGAKSAAAGCTFCDGGTEAI